MTRLGQGPGQTEDITQRTEFTYDTGTGTNLMGRVSEITYGDPASSPVKEKPLAPVGEATANARFTSKTRYGQRSPYTCDGVTRQKDCVRARPYAFEGSVYRPRANDLNSTMRRGLVPANM
jgi:hypothetical protein